jgi:uncharacterized repeat protein (TIGR02543 family)
VFGDSPSLTSATFESGVTSIPPSMFERSTALTSVTIPASVTIIGDAAFGLTALTSVTIPAGVTSIGMFAFFGSTELDSIYFLGNAPATVGTEAFEGVASGAKAYIKSGTTGFTTSGTPPLWNELEVAVGVYTASYNTNGGSTIAAQAYTRSISEPAVPTRTGYTFAGWSATTSGSLLTFPYTPTSNGDLTLYAKWTQNPTKAVAPVKPSITGKATSTAKGTNKLTAKKGTWTGYPLPAISYQWYSCSTQVKSVTATIPKTCKAISKATKSTFAVTKTYKGKYLAVAVTGKASGTSATKWLSKSTAKVK